MKNYVITAILTGFAWTSLLAQNSEPPLVLPTTILKPPSTTQKPFAKDRDVVKPTIISINEELKKFEPEKVELKRTESGWVIYSGDSILRSFGNDSTNAANYFKLIKNLNADQMGTIPGSTPPFEYWLHEGKPIRLTNAKISFFPVGTKPYRAENVGEMWMLTDGFKMLYQFGKDAENAKRAAAIFRKYGFTKIGFIGDGQPTALIPYSDGKSELKLASASSGSVSQIEIADSITKNSLLLPGNHYAGPKFPFTPNKVEAVKSGNNWMLIHRDQVLGNFGTSEYQAKLAQRALSGSSATDLIFLGDKKYPILLMSGTPLRQKPLGVESLTFQPDRLRVLKINESFSVCHDRHPLITCASKADADLMLLTIKHFEFNTLLQFGRADAGFPLLIKN